MKQNREIRERKKEISKASNLEKVFLSFILMNKGKIPAIKFKRIYLDRYSLWELQETEKKLVEKGLVVKSGEKTSKGLSYEVPRELIEVLSESFLSSPSDFDHIMQLEPSQVAPCGEYSILWYLWQMDSEYGFHLFRKKGEVGTQRISQKKIEELLATKSEETRFFISVYKALPALKSLSKRKYKKWSNVLISPHRFVKDIFKFTYDFLREGNELGREDVGKDNIEFFFDELSALDTGRWYSLDFFVSNARATLFLSNQPFRWIHFDEKNVWKILNQKLKVVGIVETFMENGDKKFFRLTKLGMYCLGEISESDLLEDMTSHMGKFMVHPNFEVTVVSNELDPRVLLELAMFSRPEKLDTMSVFRITKDTVGKGKRLGLTPSEMTAFLKERCKGGIPQNVEYSILDWSH
ncbi:MAG: hypothetical protein JSW00_17515 [Thermoplasmata archaeon]|nr:MAG: hypothetical protein JSW00_17515 [Thermoplasmata archaeon]